MSEIGLDFILKSVFNNDIKKAQEVFINIIEEIESSSDSDETTIVTQALFKALGAIQFNKAKKYIPMILERLPRIRKRYGTKPQRKSSETVQLPTIEKVDKEKVPLPSRDRVQDYELSEIEIVRPDKTYSEFLKSILDNLSSRKVISFDDFQNSLNTHYSQATQNLDEETFMKASGIFAYVVFGEPFDEVQKLLFQDFVDNKTIFKRLGLYFSFLPISERNKLVKTLEVISLCAKRAKPVFELKRLVRVANKLGMIDLEEKDMLNFFTDYLNGSLDEILLNPPRGVYYLKVIERIHDYSFDTNFENIVPDMKCDSEELHHLYQQLCSVFTRVKIAEWAHSVAPGEKTTLLDLVVETQSKILGLNVSKPEDLVSLEKMFLDSEKNIIQVVIDYFSKKLAYKYILRIRGSGVGKNVQSAFKDLAGLPTDLGKSVLDLVKYYQAIHPDWEQAFVEDFIFRRASEGLYNSQKRWVKDQIRLFVEGTEVGSREPDTQRYEIKISSETILEALQTKISVPPPRFNTSEEAQNYLVRIFEAVKAKLEREGIKNILRSGFILYIERQVAEGWSEELEDLSIKLIGYWQYLQDVVGQPSQINTLVIDSLKEVLNIQSGISEEIKDQELGKFIECLPKAPLINDPASAKQYLEIVYNEAKRTINSVLDWGDVEETSRKTFSQELAGKMGFDVLARSWFSKGFSFYESIITDQFKKFDKFDQNQNLVYNQVKESIYGGVIYLVEDALQGRNLGDAEKIKKAKFLADFLLTQTKELISLFQTHEIPLNELDITQFILSQISLFASISTYEEIFSILASDNTMLSAVDIEQKRHEKFNKNKQFYYKQNISFDSINFDFREHSAIRGLISHQVIDSWIRRWANSVYEFIEKRIDIISSKVDVDPFLYEAFQVTGRDSIINFIVPFLALNLPTVNGVQDVILPNELENYNLEPSGDLTPFQSQLVSLIYSITWQQLTGERVGL
ncbi:MAG: hypothetical protein ACFFC7_06770 [Candidatus Hermodarchaeota archaeon]